jgi:hypothetical protein
LSDLTRIISFLNAEFIGGILYTSNSVQIGDKVLILRPAYVIGKVGVVCGMESNSQTQASKRWIIEIESENMVVSLTSEEFQRFSPGLT